MLANVLTSAIRRVARRVPDGSASHSYVSVSRSLGLLSIGTDRRSGPCRSFPTMPSPTHGAGMVDGSWIETLGRSEFDNIVGGADADRARLGDHIGSDDFYAPDQSQSEL